MTIIRKRKKKTQIADTVFEENYLTSWPNFKFRFRGCRLGVKNVHLQSTRFTHEHTTSNIHKIFHSPIWFFNYEMILRTHNCTIVNQIKSSKKLVVKLKIRNLQLLQMKTVFKLFFSRVRLFSRGNKWATVSPPRCVFKICTRSLVVSCIKTQDV